MNVEELRDDPGPSMEGKELATGLEGFYDHQMSYVHRRQVLIP